jgi:oligopeptide transport system substrate-binding protein
MRSGWIQDYPHIENFLTPLYGTGASSNDSAYSNPKFDAKLKEAAKATGDDSLALYKEAEEMLLPDMPAIPMWYYTATIGWSDKVTDVRVSQASGRPDLFAMKQK